MTQNNFTTSPPATGGDAALAADLITDAAYATMIGGDTDRARVDERAHSALDHPHPDVRVSAIGALARIGTLSTDDVRRLSHDPSPSVRRRAVEATATLIQDGHGTPTMLEGLLEALGDDPAVTEIAAFAIGEFGPEVPEITGPAVAVLEQVASEHPESLCREAAIAALGALHQGRGVVLEALKDKATVRRRAVLALAPFVGSDVDAALDRAITDRDWQVRQAAEDLIAARR
jgi:HEAT repeat protein